MLVKVDASPQDAQGCAPVDQRHLAGVAGELQRAGTDQEESRLRVSGACGQQLG